MGGPNSGRRKEIGSTKVSSGKIMFDRHLYQDKTDYDSVTDIFDEGDEWDQRIRDHKKMRQMEAMKMPKSVIDEFKAEHGLGDGEPVESDLDMSQTGRMEQAANLLNATEDPVLKKLIIFNLFGSNRDPVMAMYMNSQIASVQNPEQKEERELYKVFVKKAMDKMDESELDRMAKAKKSLESMGELFGTKKTTLEDIAEQKKMLIDLGMVQEPKDDSIETRKLDVEMKKLELEDTRLTKQFDSEFELKKVGYEGAREGIDIGMKFLTTLFNADRGKKKEDLTYKDGSRPQMSPPFKCSNPDCSSHAEGKKIQIVMEKNKEFECPYDCKFSYIIDENMQVCNSEKSQKDLDKKRQVEEKQEKEKK